jgi:hypothetical protein
MSFETFVIESQRKLAALGASVAGDYRAVLAELRPMLRYNVAGDETEQRIFVKRPTAALSP